MYASTIPAGCDRRVHEMLARSQFLGELDEPETLDDDQTAEAILAGIDAFVDTTDDNGWVERRFNPDELRDPHGRWTRSIGGRIAKALEEWSKGNGPDDPFTLDGKPVEREPLRKVAVARGIELKRGATRDEIAAALKDDIRGEVKTRKAEVPHLPGAPKDHRRFTIQLGGKVDPAAVREIEVENKIRQAWNDAQKAPGGWVGFARLRGSEPLRDVPREEVDAALKRLAREPGVRVAPNENTKSLHREDIASAVQVGDSPRHMIAFERGHAQSASGKTPLRPLPKSGTATDVGIFGNPSTGKLSLYRESDTGKRTGRAIKSFDDMGALESWARDNGHTELADYAKAEQAGAGVKSALDALGANSPIPARPGTFDRDAVAEAVSRAPNEQAALAELTHLNLKQLRTVAVGLNMPLPPPGTGPNASVATLAPHIAKTSMADRVRNDPLLHTSPSTKAEQAKTGAPSAPAAKKADPAAILSSLPADLTPAHNPLPPKRTTGPGYHVGFTGTREGMTTAQREQLRTRLADVKAAHPDAVFHYGQAVGADAEAAQIAHDQGFRVVSHPSNLAAQTAPSIAGAEAHPPKPPLARNRDIVSSSDVVLATPRTPEEQLRSGTWATIREARRTGAPVEVLSPSAPKPASAKKAADPAEILAQLPSDLTPAQKRARLRSRGVPKEQIDALVPLKAAKVASGVPGTAVVIDRLKAATTREEGHAALDGLTVADLKVIAKQHSISIAGMTKADLKTAIVERIVGSRINSKAIRESVDYYSKPVTRALGHDVTPGHDELHHYWTRGEGLAKWAGSPRPWTTLRDHLLKYLPPEEATRAASRWFIEVFGFASGSDLNRVTHGQPPRGKVVGPG